MRRKRREEPLTELRQFLLSEFDLEYFEVDILVGDVVLNMLLLMAEIKHAVSNCERNAAVVPAEQLGLLARRAGLERLEQLSGTICRHLGPDGRESGLTKAIEGLESYLARFGPVSTYLQWTQEQ